MELQWYPGHMAKTRRLIEENLKLVDIIVEVIDARIPKSSRNPDLDAIFKSKPRIVVMNKVDLADDKLTAEWQNRYKKQGAEVILANSLTGKGADRIDSATRKLLSERIEKDEARGLNRSIKIMVVGIPNVGKSSFINRLCKKASAKTGDRPGVTKGKQWIRIKSGLELLDTPGILWPKFEDKAVGERLAYVGSIKDEIMDTETLCVNLLEVLKDKYPELLKARYKLEDIPESADGYEILEMISRKRGFVISSGETDTYRGANVIIDEFRAAKIGKITLESPEKE